jgi:hypothetical protein
MGAPLQQPNGSLNLIALRLRQTPGDEQDGLVRLSEARDTEAWKAADDERNALQKGESQQRNSCTPVLDETSLGRDNAVTKGLKKIVTEYGNQESEICKRASTVHNGLSGALQRSFATLSTHE